MADRYLKATGDWSDANTWSATDGGVAGASAPTSSDDVFITANGNGLTLTVDAASACASLTASGGSTATLSMGTTLNIYGSMLLLPTMDVTGPGSFRHRGTGATDTWTTAGKTLGSFQKNSTGTLTLQDSVIATTYFETEGGTLNTNGQTITTATFQTGYIAGATTVNLGASVIDCGAWEDGGGATVDLTLNAGTSSIRVTGTGGFQGAGKTFYEVQLNGTAHTITGNNTFASLAYKPAGNQTITATGTTQTFGTMSRIGEGTITIVNGAFTKTGGGKVRLYKMSISGNTASPAYTFYAGIGSTDGGTNANWYFSNGPKSFMNLTPRKIYNPRLGRITRGLR